MQHVDCNCYLIHAHGHTAERIKGSLRMVQVMHYPDLQVIAGNVATGEGNREL